jgi:tetratricopeptide (TPR) repeat protein
MKKLLLLLVVISLSGFGQTATDYFNKGISKFNLKDYQGAITDYKKCIQLKPDYVLALLIFI